MPILTAPPDPDKPKLLNQVREVTQQALLNGEETLQLLIVALLVFVCLPLPMWGLSLRSG